MKQKENVTDAEVIRQRFLAGVLGKSDFVKHNAIGAKVARLVHAGANIGRVLALPLMLTDEL